MAASTLRSGIASTTNNAAVVSASFTPAANDLLVVFTIHSGKTTNPVMSVSANGITFTAVTNALFATSANIITMWVADQLVGASPVAMTVTTTPTASTGGIIFVYSVSGLTRTGTSAIRQSAAQANGAAAATPTMTFGGVALTANPLLASVSNGANPAALTPPTSWTETATIGDIGYATPATGGETAFRDSGTTASSVAYGASSATAFGLVAAEMDTSAAPAAAVYPDRIRVPGHEGHPRSAAAQRASRW